MAHSTQHTSSVAQGSCAIYRYNPMSCEWGQIGIMYSLTELCLRHAQRAQENGDWAFIRVWQCRHWEAFGPLGD